MSERIPAVVMNSLSIGGFDACWEWKGARRKGYGRVRLDGKRPSVHRLVYSILRGPIPEGLQLDHLCRNRACANPKHLEPVTHRENQLRGKSFSAQNARKTHCVNGHEFTPENTRQRPGGHRGCRACEKLHYLWQKARWVEEDRREWLRKGKA